MRVNPASGIMPTHFEAVMVLTVGIMCPTYVDQYGLLLNYVTDCKISEVQVGSATKTFSYNLPSVMLAPRPDLATSVRHAGLDSRGDSISIRGLNFGAQGYSNKVMSGGTVAPASRWISDSSLNIRFGDGLQGSRLVVVTVGSQGTTTNIFTYFSPAIMDCDHHCVSQRYCFLRNDL